MYGTNGYYLTFGNTASTTTIGYDTSGNNNNFTSSGISLTAGTTYDAMTDVPTNTSATVANYAVLNSLNIATDCTLSQANLTVAYGTNATRGPMQGTIGMTTGKWYFEAVCTASSVSPTSNLFIGIANKTMPSELGNFTGANASGWGFNSNGGTVYNNNVSTAYGSSASVNDIVGVAFDADTGKLYFSINGTFQNSGNPTTGTNPAYTVASDTYYPSIGDGSGASTLTASINFGQRPFSYTPPTGFVALNTFNLPTPTILQGNKYMDAIAYNGSDASQKIITPAQFYPDFVWAKSRNNVTNHILMDTVRGGNVFLSSNATTAETTSSGLATFSSNGVTWTGGAAGVNASTYTYVNWAWNAGSNTTSSNTSGSITSTVSVNATAGFSVVTFNSTSASGTSTIGHGLGAVPAMLIMKDRTTAYGWDVWTKGLGAITNSLILQTTAAVSTTRQPFGSVSPTSSVFTFNNAFYAVSNDNIVVYAWAEIAGFSKFGSYTGNASTDGPFVFTNFRPKYVLIKRTDTTGSWRVWDTSRSTYNVSAATLLPNGTDAELTTSNENFDILSNGFKLRNADSDQNANGGTYIYAAYAENPFKNANAR
jgi:hypothetical protein